MQFYGHDKNKALTDSKGQPTTLLFPSGNNHVLLPNGQHVNPDKRHETKKARLARRKAARQIQPVSFPMVMKPNVTHAEHHR